MDAWQTHKYGKYCINFAINIVLFFYKYKLIKV